MTSIGIIATTEDNKIITYELFNDETIVSSIEAMNDNLLLDSEITLINRLPDDYDEIIIETRKNSDAYQELDSHDKISVMPVTDEGCYIRDNFEEIALQLGVDKEELRSIQSNAYNSVCYNQIRESVKTNDLMITQTINSLNELEETTGKLIEQLREWTTPYLPELNKLHNNQLYTKIIARETSRENIIDCDLLKDTNIVLDKDYDVNLTSEDLAIIKTYAMSLESLYDSKNKLEEYISEKMEIIAPNLALVAGDNLGAKLIAHTRGLDNLAKLPSSTVQIIGAEKATFRHLKTGENPPKHGLIFQHPAIRGSNWWVRGKLARAVASKITIAARKDAFGGEYDPQLKVQLDEKVDKIKKDHPFPEKRSNKKSEDKKKKVKKHQKKKQKRSMKKMNKGKRNKMKINPKDIDY
ncbi:MAG: NOP58 family protein [Methanosphaera sp.]|nr:NOP58 family protein [Methanosphaera sp.]